MIVRQQDEPPHLGELELAIMEVLWLRSQATVREVLDGLERAPAPGYTTVATVLNRLVEKGMLRRTRAGRVDCYHPTCGREEFDQRKAGAVVRGLVAEYGDLALAQFATALEEADPELLTRLRERIAPSGKDDQHA